MFLAVMDGFGYHSKIDPMLLMQHGIRLFAPRWSRTRFYEPWVDLAYELGHWAKVQSHPEMWGFWREHGWPSRSLPLVASDMNQFDMKLPKDPVQCRRCRRCLFLKLRFQWFGWGIVLHSDERIEAKGFFRILAGTLRAKHESHWRLGRCQFWFSPLTAFAPAQ